MRHDYIAFLRCFIIVDGFRCKDRQVLFCLQWWISFDIPLHQLIVSLKVTLHTSGRIVFELILLSHASNSTICLRNLSISLINFAALTLRNLLDLLLVQKTSLILIWCGWLWLYEVCYIFLWTRNKIVNSIRWIFRDLLLNSVNLNSSLTLLYLAFSN